MPVSRSGVSRSGQLVAWSNAFFAGQASLDQVVDKTTLDTDGPHRVVGLPGRLADADAVAPLRELLVAWRRAGQPARVVLPVPGDVRGLAGPAQFRDQALEAGEAAVAGQLGVVPEIIEFTPSSAPWSVTWTAWALGAPGVDYESVADAQYGLSTAIRETASALAAADVVGRSGGDPESLHYARRAGERLRLPPSHPPRAVALIAQAERLGAILDLARADPVGGAVDRRGMAARDSALRPLAVAVRRARVAGYSALG